MSESHESRLKTLAQALGSSDGSERKRARETLVLIGEPAISLLQRLLASQDRLLRWEAVKTLVAMVEPVNLEHFVALLADERSDLRWLAASGLIALGPRSVVPVLQALTQDAASRGRREMSHRVLKELSADNSVLAELLAPVTAVLRGDDPEPVASRAARALSDWEGLTTL